MNYCMKCGEHRDSGTHWFLSTGHQFVPIPEGARWVFKPKSCVKFLVLPTNQTPNEGENK